MSICSVHRVAVDGCKLCHAKPWDVFKTTEDDWNKKLDNAKSEGVITCPKCDFGGMYKKTCRQSDGRYLCPCCSNKFEL
jgi:formylmethanofuran dehydrogenase subunit E